MSSSSQHMAGRTRTGHRLSAPPPPAPPRHPLPDPFCPSLASDLCDAAASLHDLGRLEHALELYDEALRATASELRSDNCDVRARSPRPSSDDWRVGARDASDPERAEARLRRMAKVQWARSVALSVGRRSLRGDGAHPPPPRRGDLDLYEGARSDRAERRRRFPRPVRSDGGARPRGAEPARSRGGCPPRTPALLHNMGLLHLQMSSSGDLGPGEPADHLMRAERLLRAALATILRGQTVDSFLAHSNGGGSDPLLLSTLLCLGLALSLGGGRDGEAKGALDSALTLARRMLEQDGAADDNSDDDLQAFTAFTVIVKGGPSSERVSGRCGPSRQNETAAGILNNVRSMAAICLAELGRIFYRSGRYEQSLTFAEDALSTMLRDLPDAEDNDDHGGGGGDGDCSCDDSDDIAAALFNVGLAYEAMGEPGRARERYAQFANLFLFKGDAGEWGCAYIVLALSKIIALDCAGGEEDGLPLAIRAILERRLALGWDHPDLIGPLGEAGSRLSELGEHGTALPFLRERLRVQRLARPHRREEHAATLVLISRALRGAGDRPAALEALQAALRARLDVASEEETVSDALADALAGYRADHPVYCSVMYNMGLVLTEAGRTNDAVRSLLLGVQMAEEFIDARCRPSAAEISEAACALHDIGSLLGGKHDLPEEAMRCLTMALRLRRGLAAAAARKDHKGARRRRPGPKNDLSIAGTLCAIARLHRDAHRFSDSLRAFGEALSIQRSALGPDHPDVAETLCAAGQVHDLAGDPQGALEYFHEALRIMRASAPPPSQPGVAAASSPVGRSDTADSHDLSISVVLNAIGTVHHHRGDRRRASMAFAEAFVVSGGRYGYDAGSLMVDFEVIMDNAFPPAAAAA